MLPARRPSVSALLRSVAILALAVPIAALAVSKKAESTKAAPPPVRKPAASIPVQPLGFQPPSMFYLADRQSSLTLDFIDDTRLLFTFRVNALIQRSPGNDQPGDQDQVIQADVLDIPTGKVLHSTRWTMHDRQRYLWPLGHGKFLVRIGNTLYQTGSSLTLQPFLTPAHPLTLVNVSPGHKYLSVETEVPADPAQLAPEVDLQGRVLAQPQHVNLAVYPAGSTQPLFRTHSLHPLDLPVMQNGFLELLSTQPQKGRGDLWLIREIEFQGLSDPAHLPARLPARDVLSFQSDCHPSLLPLSPTVVLTGCAGDGADHLMTAVDLNGNKLWQQWWQARYLWHTMAYASGGSRFALGSLMTDRPLATLSPASINDVERQLVGVFDTTTGKLVLVRDANPIVSAGQNFALNATGTRFAILRNQAIEIYNLPPSNPTPPAATKAAH
ncbi:MAG: hypothetical protein ACP5M4_11075 [Acidobacteriaceae bacterium]